MAEGIASGLAQTISTQLASLALEEVGSARGVKEEVRRLESMLAAIKGVLPHAENLQLSNNDVKSWLRRIKDAAYDAEDAIDDFATEILRKKLAMQGNVDVNPARRIKEVRVNLKDIFDAHQSYGLQKGFQANCGFISEGWQTHSYILKGKIIGRDAEKERIVKLLLDDIWNEELDKWEELRDLLTGGGSGSKIIITTRSKRVGLLMGTTVIHRLSELSEGDCWNLFKSRAFEEAKEDTFFFSRSEEDAYDELVEIGREIAKKCVGVPLAAKTLGGLCYQAKKQTWEFVRDNDVWRLPEEKNGILRALRISYNHLSFSLKQCFAYCSIFPKDYETRKDMLIELWTAQGFIIPLFGENQLPEEIGNEYVEILMWRSFFQEPKVDVV